MNRRKLLFSGSVPCKSVIEKSNAFADNLGVSQSQKIALASFHQNLCLNGILGKVSVEYPMFGGSREAVSKEFLQENRDIYYTDANGFDFTNGIKSDGVGYAEMPYSFSRNIKNKAVHFCISEITRGGYLITNFDGSNEQIRIILDATNSKIIVQTAQDNSTRSIIENVTDFNGTFTIQIISKPNANSDYNAAWQAWFNGEKIGEDFFKAPFGRPKIQPITIFTFKWYDGDTGNFVGMSSGRSKFNLQYLAISEKLDDSKIIKYHTYINQLQQER